MASGPNTPAADNTGTNGQPIHTKIGTDADPTRGMPYHDKLTADLKQALNKKKMIDKALVCPSASLVAVFQILTKSQAQIDEAIYRKESEYLEETPYGNIITGFDSYIKGVTSSSVAGRKRTAINDNDRIFSRITNRAGPDFTDSPGALSGGTTPSAAPTPVTSSFPRDRGDASAVSTPTSASSKAGQLGKNKKKGKVDVAEDSEMSEREGGRKRARK